MSEYEALVAEHGGVARAARALGIPRSTFSTRLQRERGGNSAAQPKQATTSGISEQELLLRHSSYHKLMQAAKELKKGMFLTQGEFVRAAGVTGGYRDILSRPEFEEFYGKVSESVVYWGHPESISKMRAEHVLH